MPAMRTAIEVEFRQVQLALEKAGSLQNPLVRGGQSAAPTAQSQPATRQMTRQSLLPRRRFESAQSALQVSRRDRHLRLRASPRASIEICCVRSFSNQKCQPRTLLPGSASTRGRPKASDSATLLRQATRLNPAGIARGIPASVAASFFRLLCCAPPTKPPQPSLPLMRDRTCRSGGLLRASDTRDTMGQTTM